MPAPVVGLRPRYAPRTGSVVDRSHSLAQGLEFCFVPSASDHLDLAKGYRATRNGALTASSTEFGRAGYPSSGTTYWSFPGVPDAPFLNDMTILFVGRTTGSSYGYIAGKKADTSNLNTPFSVYFESNALSGATRTVVPVARGNASTWVGRNYWRSGDFVANQTYVIVMSMPALLEGTDTPGYANGSALSVVRQVVNAGTGSVTGNGDPLTLGARPADSLNSGVVVNHFAIWSRIINAAESRALYADPFCFLRY